MRRGMLTSLLVLAALLAVPVARADVWDIGTDTDNTTGTDNELITGIDQVHDVAAQGGGTIQDVDWYRFNRGCNASYEVILDSMTGGVSNGNDQPAFQIVDSNGVTVLLNAIPITGFGVAQRLVDFCASPTTDPERTGFVRVMSPACGVNCGSNAQYRIRVHETTALVPRFNNANGQVTVLVVQNTTDQDAQLALVPYDPSGAVIPPVIAPHLSPNEVLTLNLAAEPSLAGRSGAIKIVNNAPYGALAGKAVALEPSTGFTFDTPITYKPQ